MVRAFYFTNKVMVLSSYDIILSIFQIFVVSGGKGVGFSSYHPMILPLGSPRPSTEPQSPEGLESLKYVSLKKKTKVKKIVDYN